MKILKFGGTSVGSAQRIKEVAQLVLQAASSDRVIVVCSAMSGVTDGLIHLCTLAAKRNGLYELSINELFEKHIVVAQSLLKDSVLLKDALSYLQQQRQMLQDIARGMYLTGECTTRSRDLVMSFGERLSCLLVALYLQTFEVKCVYLDAREVVRTDDTFGNARVDFEKTNEQMHAHQSLQAPICVVTGFIGASSQGETTTLGRGGSDYTASIFGAGLGASDIQIWTDVDGILTADPRVVSHTKLIPHISYEEAMELAHFGAKVIYPPTMQPALEKQIPIWIKNTFRPEMPGTLIDREAPVQGGPVTALSAIKEVSLVLLQGSGLIGAVGTAARMFQALSKQEVNVLLITQGSSEHSICVAILPEDAPRAAQAIDEAFELDRLQHRVMPAALESGLSIITAVGDRMRRTPGISGRLFGALGRAGVNVVAIAQGSSERNISVVVNQQDRDRALQTLHQEFFWYDDAIHLFLVGTGQIGSELLKQINALGKKGISVHGMCNAAKMFLCQEPIDLTQWQTVLTEQGQPMVLSDFVSWVKDQPFVYKVFVDCTANTELPDSYETLLESGIFVVTPNKKAASGHLEFSQRLRTYASQGRFVYTTNVGAGLPILSSLRDLLSTGDSILEIRGVFSGTMSYLFNVYDGSRPFSLIVQEAKEKGYTEPDPKEDLSGMDVVRKLLILAREIGIEAEREDVEVESLAEVSDDVLAQRMAQAKERGFRLRYIGEIKQGKLSVGVKVVTPEDPCFGLTGTENIVIIRTARYDRQPLVIRGPGAGLEVTAAGVLRDIVHTKHL